MIEGLKDAMNSQPDRRSGASFSDETVESAALAGAAAIQRLIAERDNFRNRASILERQMAGLHSDNGKLRRRIALIRRHYIELATNILAQLERFDSTTREAMSEGDPAPHQEDDNLIALAHRLAPRTDQ